MTATRDHRSAEDLDAEAWAPSPRALRRRPGRHRADRSSTSAAASASTRRSASGPRHRRRAGRPRRRRRALRPGVARAAGRSPATLTVDDATRRPGRQPPLTLPEAHAIVLLDEEHPAYPGALADVAADRRPDPRPAARRLPHRRGRALRRLRAARHAGRVHPADVRQRPGRPTGSRPCPTSTPASRPASRCGSPTSAAARAGPASTSPRPTRNVTVDGFDLDDASIAAARKHASGRGVADRVRFEVQDVDRSRLRRRRYDLVDWPSR